MAISVSFGSREIIEPGAYSQVRSVESNVPFNAPYGKVLIIDDGLGAGWGGGSGISGELDNSQKAIYSFKDLPSFTEFVGGGILWDLADYIFNPQNGVLGAPEVAIVRAATTTCASLTMSFTDTTGGATFTATVASGVITGIAVVDGGSGFPNSGTTIVITDTTGTLATATATVASGVITAVTVTSGGSGYSSSPTISAAGASVGGTFTLKTLNEGLRANGVLDSIPLNIVKGYGSLMKRGINDINKFIVEFYQGNWRGLDPDGDDYGGIDQLSSQELLIARSPEFSNFSTLLTWLQNDSNLSKRFKFVSGSVTGNGDITQVAFTNNSASKTLASGATETYGSGDFDKVLENIVETDNTFFLSLKYGDNSQHANNVKILSFIVNDSEFQKFLNIGGGIDDTRFVGHQFGSIETAQFYDSPYVSVVHSGAKIPRFSNPNSLKTLPAIYHAAVYTGIMAGLQPQTPGTFKKTRLNNFNHVLTTNQRKLALQNGVVHNRFVAGIGNVINQSINTMQNNSQLYNRDGTSFEQSIMSISAQLNKEISLNLRKFFIGGNLNTSSPEDVKLFIESYLLGKVATKIEDNLIIAFKEVRVKQDQDFYDITYKFAPNGPVNKMFSTGFIFDPKITA